MPELVAHARPVRRWGARVVDAVPGAFEVLPGIVYLPGQTSLRELTAGSLLLEGERPLLVDAGMSRPVAEALRALDLPVRLHLTHMHLDHRLHEPWFLPPRVSAPAVEAEAIRDWDHWLSLGGFDGPLRTEMDLWRKGKVGDGPRPAVDGFVEGDALAGVDVPAVVRMLPGHTEGHSGIEWPGMATMLVTDYDMEPFGPWYANTTSDLEAYERTLRDLLERTDIERWITSHRRGVLGAEAFAEGARRYLAMLEERSARILDWLAEAPARIEDLAVRGLCYPEGMLRGGALFRAFEGRMIHLHLERLAGLGLATREGDLWRRS